MSEIELVLRVVVAALLGAVLGIERELNQKTAGLRTHTLVAAGAALFAVVGAFALEGSSLDPTRIAAGVVTGIGFIGAGGMIRSGFTVSGITTAATLWFAAALGVAAGFGLYVVAIGSLVVALVVMVGLAPLRRYVRRVHHLEIVYEPGHGTLTPLFETLNAVGAHVRDMTMTESGGTRTLEVEVAGLGPETLDELVHALQSREEVRSVATEYRRLA